MGQPGNREVIRTHSLFIDDLKVYQKNHARPKDANETIVQASYWHSTGRRLEENLEKTKKRKSRKGEKNYELKIIRARICKASITKDLTWRVISD